MIQRKPLPRKGIGPLVRPDYTWSRSELILTLISTFRFLTQRQIDRFLDPFPSEPSRVLNLRCLKRLLRNGLVRRFRLGNKYVYCRKKPSGEQHLKHDLLVIDVILRFLEEAQKEAHELVHAEMEVDLAGVKPDGYLIYEAGKTYHFFLEIDTGSQSSKVFVEKLERYERYFRSGTWKKEFDVFPWVLVICPGENRVLLLTKSSENEGVFFTTISSLFSLGPFATIWTAAGHSEQRSLR